MIDINTIAIKAGTDKAVPHHYTGYYETHLAPLRNDPVKLIEIGVASRASLVMWDEYFNHPDTFIIGVDIDPDTYDHVADRVKIIIGDGTQYIAGIEQLDVVIDDGSHVSNDIIASFTQYWPHVNSGGWYIIEDWAVQSRVDYGGDGFSSPAVSMAKGILSEVLIWTGTGPSEVSELHAYSEIIFIRKK